MFIYLLFSLALVEKGVPGDKSVELHDLSSCLTSVWQVRKITIQLVVRASSIPAGWIRAAYSVKDSKA